MRNEGCLELLGSRVCVWKQLHWLVTVVNAVLLVEQWWSEGQSIVVWPWQLFFVYLGRAKTKEGKSNPINDNGQNFLYVRMCVVSANNTTRISGGLAPVYRIYSCFLFDCFKVNINTWSSTYKTHGNFMFLKFFFIFSLLIIECYKMITRSRVSIPVTRERSTIWAARASWNAVYQSWPTTPVSFKIELLCKSKNQILRAVRGIFSTCLRGRFKHDWLSPVGKSPAVTNFPRSSTRRFIIASKYDFYRK